MAVASVGILVAAVPAEAARAPISHPHVVAHFGLSRGETPENIALEPDGEADVTFAVAAQVARVSLDGHVRILAQLPTSTTGAPCPLPGFPELATGIARDHHGTLYVALCVSDPDLAGIWQISAGASPTRLAALPVNGVPNGIALDDHQGFIYVADSVLSTVWRVSLVDHTVSAWSSGPQLAPGNFIGANGLKVHGRAVWVTNTQLGTLIRIPIESDGSAGAMHTVATGLVGIDDFAFVGHEDTVLAAINGFSKVALIQPNGSHQTVLTAADGLSNPSSIAVRGKRLYVTNAAYLTRRDPNLLLAHLDDESD